MIRSAEFNVLYKITFNNSLFSGDAQQENNVNIGAVASGGIIGGFIMGFLVATAVLRFLKHCQRGIVTIFI